jgi:hypothetical protein
MKKTNLNKPFFLLLCLLVTTLLLSQVFAGSSTVYLSTNEYSDVSSILAGNSAKWANVINYESSAHPVYANLWFNSGETIVAKKAVLYNPGGGGTTPFYSGTGNWQLELNPIGLYRDCTANGTLITQ